MTIRNPLSQKAEKAFIAAAIKEMASPKEFKIPVISREDERRERLLRPQVDPIEFRQTRKEYYDNLLCLFDGFKLRSYDPVYIDWLISQEQFNYQITTHSEDGRILQYNGLYKYDPGNPFCRKGIVIHIHMVSGRRWVADISGSFHNWSNKGFNYNDYYWKDFLKVYQEMCNVFRFDPESMWVVNLEVGANLLVHQWLNLSISEIMENILSIGGVCKNKRWEEKNDRNVYKVKKGERYWKVYDKTRQYKLREETIRMEWGSNHSREIKKTTGVLAFSDLIKISTLFKCKELLKRAFVDMHVHQPGLHQEIALDELGADRNIAVYNTPGFWCRQKKSSKKYKKARQNKERLIATYCSYNLERSLKKMLNEKLR